MLSYYVWIAIRAVFTIANAMCELTMADESAPPSQDDG